MDRTFNPLESYYFLLCAMEISVWVMNPRELASPCPADKGCGPPAAGTDWSANPTARCYTVHSPGGLPSLLGRGPAQAVRPDQGGGV